MTDLEEDFYEADRAAWRRRLPWLLTLDTARVAADPRKLLLAAVGILIVNLAWAGIDRLPFATIRDDAPPALLPGDAVERDGLQYPPGDDISGGFVPGDDMAGDFQRSAETTDASVPVALSTDLRSRPGGVSMTKPPLVGRPGWAALSRDGLPITGLTTLEPMQVAAATGASLLLPLEQVNTPLVGLTAAGSSWSRVADLTLRVLAALFAWALFGGAIARLAGLRMTGDHRTSLVDALRYAAKSLIASVGGAITPLVGFVALWGVVALAGLVYQIPVAGPFIVAVLWIVILTLGLFATILLVGVLLSWPLMVLTMSIEGTDAFDALSRAFGYLFGRPLYLAGLVLLLLVIGSVATFVVQAFADVAAFLSVRFFTTGYGSTTGEAAATLFGGEPTAAGSIALWITNLWTLLAASYPVAFFWTGATAVYLLLRRSFEGTSVDQIWIPPSEQKDDLLPLVGEPAAERREASLKAASGDNSEPPPTGETPAPTTNSETAPES